MDSAIVPILAPATFSNGFSADSNAVQGCGSLHESFLP
jgi:hypothetical protein